MDGKPVPAGCRGRGERGDIASPPARILVIDDNASTRDTFRDMLAADGYVVSTAATVEAGLADAAREMPAAILMDLHMPIAGGLECLRELRGRQEWLTVPVAILTGDYFLDASVAAELRSLGANVHFKPLWDEDLRRVVEELLRRRTA